MGPRTVGSPHLQAPRVGLLEVLRGGGGLGRAADGAVLWWAVSSRPWGLPRTAVGGDAVRPPLSPTGAPSTPCRPTCTQLTFPHAAKTVFPPGGQGPWAPIVGAQWLSPGHISRPHPSLSASTGISSGASPRGCPGVRPTVPGGPRALVGGMLSSQRRVPGAPSLSQLCNASKACRRVYVAGHCLPSLTLSVRVRRGRHQVHSGCFVRRLS